MQGGEKQGARIRGCIRARWRSGGCGGIDKTWAGGRPLYSVFREFEVCGFGFRAVFALICGDVLS